MLNNKKLYYFSVFLIAMIWYILWAFLIAQRYSGEWAAYALAIYVSGFLEVGIEKFFYTQTRKSENVIHKGDTCIFAVALPTAIAVLCCEAAYITSTNSRYITAFCLIVTGTAAYRLIYWLASKILTERYYRR